ncbi:hypothetical protein ACQKGC_13340 [Allorhizobium pseudoryzae]|uniref:hypothetical protein n=1 Tax=Allorhizobium pseudoryzae TaxID=379684 RepID=UPI003D021427
MEPKNHMSEMEQAEGDRGTVERELQRQDKKLAEDNRTSRDDASSQKDTAAKE